MEWFNVLCFLIILLISLSCYCHNYWTRLGFKQMKTSFLFGNIGELCKMKTSIAELFGRLYEETKTHKLIGIYLFYRPFLLINDPEVIQDVLIKNFHNFSDHGLYIDESYEHDPLSNHLFSLRGEKWKNLRSKLNPLFSPGKMKMMFPTFVSCAKRLQMFIEKHADSPGEALEFRDLFARYTTDIIASTAFGFDNDSINDPDNEFRRIGQKVFQPSLKAAFRSLFTFLLPHLNKFVGVKTVDDEVESFMFKIVEEQIKFREENNVQRNDFMQMMISLKNGGIVNEDGQISESLTLKEIVAQTFVFFIAAFETTSSTMVLCLYELAKNQLLQRTVQDEIDRVLKGVPIEEISYDKLSQLKFLECCILETLRKYPPAPFLIRECVKDYRLPGKNITIPLGTPMIIPTFGLHRDPDIYENPMEWDPARFLPARKEMSKGVYYPFGDGPRICIGMRMGKLTSILGIVALLSKFNVDFIDCAPRGELKFVPEQFVLTLKDKIHLKVSSRDCSPVKAQA